MRRLLPALLAVLACAACTAPIFDPSAFLAYRTLESIPAYASTGYLEIPGDFDVRNDDFTFLPQRMANRFDESRGFVLRAREGKTEIWYEWPDGGGTRWMRNDWNFSDDQMMPSQWAVWLKNGQYLRTIDIKGSSAYVDRLYADTSTSSLYFYPSPHTSNQAQDIGDQFLGGVCPVMVGMSVTARNTPAQDKICALVVRNGNQFTEVTTDFWDAALVGPWSSVWGVDYDLTGFLGTPWRLVYLRDINNNRSFAQSYDGTRWKTWVWWGIQPSENAALANVTHRIDAALNVSILPPPESYLFSAEEQVGRVYKFDGVSATLVAEFPLGPLRFIGEAYIDGVWRMLFSRCILDTGQNRIRFEIRALSTVDLLTIFGL